MSFYRNGKQYKPFLNGKEVLAVRNGVQYSGTVIPNIELIYSLSYEWAIGVRYKYMPLNNYSGTYKLVVTPNQNVYDLTISVSDGTRTRQIGHMSDNTAKTFYFDLTTEDEKIIFDAGDDDGGTYINVSIYKINRITCGKICFYGDSISSHKEKAVMAWDGKKLSYFYGKSGGVGENVALGDFWCHKVASKLSAPYTCVAHSGAPVSGVFGTSSDKHLCNSKMINLVPTDCEYIVVLGGINDLNYYSNGYDVNFDAWDNVQTTDEKTDSFAKAYALMVQMLLSKSSTVKVLCCKLLPHVREDGSLYEHNGVSDVVLSRIIESVVTQNSEYGSRLFLIDMNCDYPTKASGTASYYEGCGITYSNCLDYTFDGLHPNIGGMQLMADKVSDTLEKIVIGSYRSRSEKIDKPGLDKICLIGGEFASHDDEVISGKTGHYGGATKTTKPTVDQKMTLGQCWWYDVAKRLGATYYSISADDMVVSPVSGLSQTSISSAVTGKLQNGTKLFFIEVGYTDFMNGTALSTFKSNLLTLLQGFVTAFPSAKFMLIGMSAMTTGENVTGAVYGITPNHNEKGIYFYEYNEQMSKVCADESLNGKVTFVDPCCGSDQKYYSTTYYWGCGITYQNVLETTTDGKHPNATGMALISDYVEDKIVNI